ncbi:BEN domain-containing protein 5-like [Melanotaenia boesemani]|uniref:BEN domain-containing protein 5-like n=1 Tax=Melanotaenia boesemani TaxID=1250792 RepID=UPI001C052061|nr:BEN domain-containing protein 5-like [Melanotaenia boesemani]
MRILEEKKAMKKTSPLLANEQKRKREETPPDSFSDSDEDGGGVVPQRIYDELKLKYHQMQRKMQDLKQDAANSKEKFAQLNKSKCELELELAKYREANLSLQQSLDEVLKQLFSQRSMMSQVSEPVTKSTTLATSPNSESEPLQLPNTPRVLEKKDGKIHIGNEVWLREEVWNKIQATRKDSLYVKELAVAIWGSSELKQRSVSGKECPTKNTEAKPPMTPDRLGTLKATDLDFSDNHCTQVKDYSSYQADCLPARPACNQAHITATRNHLLATRPPSVYLWNTVSRCLSRHYPTPSQTCNNPLSSHRKSHLDLDHATILVINKHCLHFPPCLSERSAFGSASWYRGHRP